MYNTLVNDTKKINISLALIFVITLLIGLFKVSSLELFSDELDVGYQAYSLLTTGKDYKGNYLPLYLDSFSESRAPLYIYATVPSIAVFGLTSQAVRYPAVLYGTLACIYLFLIIFHLTKNHFLSFASALLLAITPWFHHYSTHGFEVSLLLFLTLAGVYYFFQYLTYQKFIFGLLSILSFALTFYTYNTANIFTPLIGLFLLFTHSSKVLTKDKLPQLIILVLAAVILLSPLVYNISTGKAANRFNLISIFNNPSVTADIVFKRTGFSSVTPHLEKFFHNKLTVYPSEFFRNYINSFSFNYLFSSGDGNPRHTPPGTSPLLFTFLPLLIIGLYHSRLSFSISRFFLFWLLIAPIPAALTVNGGTHATRTFLLLPPLIYFTAAGIDYLRSFRFKFILLPSLLFLIFLNAISNYHEYYSHYPKESFISWNYGYRDLFSSIPQDYNRLFISHTNYNSLLPYLFYNRISPQLLHSQNFTDQSHPLFANGLSGFQLSDNIFFITSWPSGDALRFISDTSQTNDTFLLYQLKDIPGDMTLSSQNMAQFINLNTVRLPNHTQLGQIIKKI